MHLPPFLILRADALGQLRADALGQLRADALGQLRADALGQLRTDSLGQDPKPQPPPPQEPVVTGPVPRDTNPGLKQTPDPGAARAPGQTCFDPQSMLLMAAMFAVFYFLLIRPQQKTEKKRREMVGKADRGDKVVTSGGIHGTIVSSDKDTVTLRVDSDVKLKVDRAAIARVINETAAAKDDGPKEGGSRKS